ncbi:MAG TPA: hypothetical protein VIE66_04365 [Methylocella sp.]
MVSNTFFRSIGGGKGSGAINSSSVGRGRAAGNAVSGYEEPKSGMAPGAPKRNGTKAPEPPRPVPPTECKQEASSVKAGGGKARDGGKF